ERKPGPFPPSPTPEPPRPRPPEPRDRLTEFLDSYDGGDCFFVTPEALRNSNVTRDVDGLGSSVAPFEVLNYEFKRQNGIELAIGVNRVTPDQCAAVNFLFRTRNQRGVAPRLDIDASELRNDGPLTGSVAEFGDRHVELLLIADDGYVF